MLEEIGWDEDIESSFLCDILRGLVLTDCATHPFYAMATIDGVEYFDSEDSFKAAYERDWADVQWSDLSDEMLAVWIDRLKNDGGLRCLL